MRKKLGLSPENENETNLGQWWCEAREAHFCFLQMAIENENEVF